MFDSRCGCGFCTGHYICELLLRSQIKCRVLDFSVAENACDSEDFVAAVLPGPQGACVPKVVKSRFAAECGECEGMPAATKISVVESAAGASVKYERILLAAVSVDQFLQRLPEAIVDGYVSIAAAFECADVNGLVGFEIFGVERSDFVDSKAIESEQAGGGIAFDLPPWSELEVVAE